MSTSVKNRLSPAQLFPSKAGSESPPSQLALSSQPLTKHWLQTVHQTILVSTDSTHPIRLNLAGGADNGQFVYFNECLSLIKTPKSPLTIVKGNRIDLDEIILEVDEHQVAGCTLVDVRSLIENLSLNGKQIQLKSVKSGNVVIQRVPSPRLIEFEWKR